MFIFVDIFFLKKRVRKYIVPKWPVLLISYWTICDRTERKLKNNIKELLLISSNNIGGNINEAWNSEKRKEFKDWLSNSSKNQIKDNLIKINIELKKLDADIALLDNITSELHEQSKMIWPESLLLVVPFFKQYPEIKKLSNNVNSFKFIVNRHTEMLIPHIDGYLSGNHHESICQLISNYLPYFYGADVRLIETLNMTSQFNEEYSSNIEEYFLKLNDHIEHIKENLCSIEEDVNRKKFIIRKLNFLTKKDNWNIKNFSFLIKKYICNIKIKNFSFLPKKDNLMLKFYDKKDIWNIKNDS
jgi:hypothetical protein